MTHQTNKLIDFLGCQIVGIRLIDAKLLKTTQHDRGEGSRTITTGRAQSIEEGRVGLSGFVEHTRIQSSSQKIVRCRQSMDVARQMQIEIFHWDDLGISTSCCTAFDTERRTLARLSDGRHNAFSLYGTQCLAETDRGGGLSFTQRRWSDTYHAHIAAKSE